MHAGAETEAAGAAASTPSQEGSLVRAGSLPGGGLKRSNRATSGLKKQASPEPPTIDVQALKVTLASVHPVSVSPYVCRYMSRLCNISGCAAAGVPVR